MIVVVIEKGENPRRFDFDKAEITIGRSEGNDLMLHQGNVSRTHARIVLKEGKAILIDLGSTTGTFVNDRKISLPQAIQSGDKIAIGDFILRVQASPQPNTAPMIEAPALAATDPAILPT